jgi:hypothetical protein
MVFLLVFFHSWENLIRQHSALVPEASQAYLSELYKQYLGNVIGNIKASAVHSV